MRLQGDVIFEELVWGELTLVRPAFGLRWERLEPDAPARELSLNAINVQIQGQEHTGRLTGDVLALQDSDTAPLSYSMNLQLTETEFASVLTEFAPQLVDKLTGTVAMPSFQFSVEGASLPDDLEKLRYGVSVTDGCIDWETTEECILEMHDQLGNL